MKIFVLHTKTFCVKAFSKAEKILQKLFATIFYFSFFALGKGVWLIVGFFKKKKKIDHSYWQNYLPKIAGNSGVSSRQKSSKDIFILGISAFYHDSSATILKNGKLIAAAAEERFTRKKHDSEFPENAIKYCLCRANISVKRLNYIGFYEIPALKLERILSSFIKTFPFSYLLFVKKFFPWLTGKFFVASLIKERLNYSGKIIFIEHHLSHAASAFYPSRFKESDIITIDGVGESTTASLGYGKENRIYLKKRLKFPNSLGLFYSTFTAYLGFRVNNGEYKVMGLAPYGEPKYLNKLRQVIDIKEDGSFVLDMSYFDFDKKDQMFSKKLVDFLEIKPRKQGSRFRQKDKDLARSVQKITEEIMVKIANSLQEKSSRKYLCMAGGVVLNSVANSKILDNTRYKDVFIQPAAGDGGGSIGAAFYIWHSLLGHKQRTRLKNANFGPRFSNRQIKQELDRADIRYCYFNDKDKLIKKTADLIKDQKIVGWFHGRMEFGPRALGYRSILADPRNAKNKEIINAKIKFREKFRPFAPSVLEDKANKFFKMGKKQDSPFMLFVFKVKNQKLPAVTHINKTSRIQTVNKKYNKQYYNLIKCFDELTGVPVVLNTSFNRRGEPIVCTPKDALSCFFGSGLDCLILENFLIDKKENCFLKYKSV